MYISVTYTFNYTAVTLHVVNEIAVQHQIQNVEHVHVSVM